MIDSGINGKSVTAIYIVYDGAKSRISSARAIFDSTCVSHAM